MNRRQAPKASRQVFGIDLGVAFGLAAALFFFVASGVVTYLNFEALKTGNQRIVQTHQAIVSLDVLLSQIQDAETGQRGYLLTGEEPYLAPYTAALRAIPVQMDDIGQRTSVNAGQDDALAELRQRVDAKLAELAQTIELQRAGQTDAALALVRSDAGKLEMDAIRAQIAAMAKEETRVRALRLAEMDGAQQRALFSTLLSGLLGVLLTIVIAVLVRGSTIARRREEWLQSGEVGLGAVMMGDRSIEQLGNSILDYLASYTGAVAAAMFVSSGGNFLRAAVHGVPHDAVIPTKVGPREGLLGRAAGERRTIVVSDVPDGYLAFGSALGQYKPRHLALVPGLIDETVNSVIELGFLGPVDERTIALLDRASESVAVAVRSAAYRGELQNLLEETQRQSEELQTQSEELRVSNEELEEQSRALKESQARLEQQQVELEQTNAQLEEQAQQLETQRDDLERANISMELKARELEQASQYKSDFLANMSHELRTPLNSSLILAKLLADNPDDNLTDEQVKYARTIQSSGNDLLNLINDILDLSKIEAGHVEIRPETVVLERLAGNLRQVFQPLAQHKALEFAVDIAADAPRTIETDPQRLEQVLKNLLSNAIKFTETGKVRLSIGPAGDAKVRFAVVDTGIGIAKDHQQSVFEAFQQADGTISRRYGGTGLGLSISRQLVRLLGGTIGLQSEPGRGSTFTVDVPAYDRAKVVPREPSSPKAAPSSPPSPQPAPLPRAETKPVNRSIDDDRDALEPNGKQILLVIEDDTTFASIVRDLSREMGFRTIVAGTAEEALRLAKDYMPSAIVLDVGLPDQSGLAVLDRLKQDVQTRHIPIHVLSAGDHTESAYSLGAVGFANKPVTREQLVEVLRKLETKLSQRMHRVLVVEDDAVQRDAVARLLGSGDVETVTASTAAECLALLKEQTFDCMVLDLSLPDASGYSLLETLSQEGAYSFPPVIVYTGRELSAVDEERLRKYSRSIIIKGAKSPERLLDEVSLFLHQVISDLPDEQQKMIRKARNRDALLEGRRILVVEDDVRNVYALTNILEPRGATIQIARNGQEALDALAKAGPTTQIDLVLMDVMMPVMDGLTATREIRRNPAWKKLPIITLTAKAMPDDQQRCIEAGANDYMAKPLDVEKLLSLVRVWMPK